MEQNACPECGYIHPPCVPGTCPVAAQMKEKEEAEARGISEQYELVNDVKNTIIHKIKGIPVEKIRDFMTKLRNWIIKEQI